jgi:hypothetical protein
MIEPILACAFGFLGVGLVVLLVCAVRQRDRERFNEQFPPISDDEFIARCSPGTNPKVALKVRRIVADCLGVEYDRIYPSSRFVEDLGAD